MDLPFSRYLDSVVKRLDAEQQRDEWTLEAELELARYQQKITELEGIAADLGDELDDWKRRYAIAVDERNRADAQIAELEWALDVATSKTPMPAIKRLPRFALDLSE